MNGRSIAMWGEQNISGQAGSNLRSVIDTSDFQIAANASLCAKVCIFSETRTILTHITALPTK